MAVLPPRPLRLRASFLLRTTARSVGTFLAGLFFFGLGIWQLVEFRQLLAEPAVWREGLAPVVLVMIPQLLLLFLWLAPLMLALPAAATGSRLTKQEALRMARGNRGRLVLVQAAT